MRKVIEYISSSVSTWLLRRRLREIIREGREEIRKTDPTIKPRSSDLGPGNDNLPPG